MLAPWIWDALVTQSALPPEAAPAINHTTIVTNDHCLHEGIREHKITGLHFVQGLLQGRITVRAVARKL